MQGEDQRAEESEPGNPGWASASNCQSDVPEGFQRIDLHRIGQRHLKKPPQQEKQSDGIGRMQQHIAQPEPG